MSADIHLFEFKFGFPHIECSLSFVTCSSFGILKQYFEPGFSAPTQNVNTCHFSNRLKILIRSVYSVLLQKSHFKWENVDIFILFDCFHPSS